MLSQVKSKEESLSVNNNNLAKKGQDILVRITSSMKTAQIYEANNLTLINQINVLFMFIQDALQNESEARLQLRENTLFFNSVRIKFDFATYESSKFLAAEFKKKEIGVLSFDPGLIEDELKAFIVFFANAPEAEDHPFEVFQEQIKTQRMEHVFLEKHHPFERMSDLDEKDAKKLAKKVFFKSIAHLREVFEREKEQKRVHLKTTRRLMQSIVNLIIQDETFMVGLSNIKNYDEYTLNHSINVCILSLCLGRRLGLDKHELMELGISSFFHDIGKLDIPKDILNKPGSLTEEERKIIERHPHLGAEILVRLKELSDLPIRALYVALEHHLKSDLSGYPKYWKKKSINLYSQIVEICDFFDAVTTDRPYRKRAFTRHEALSMMLEKSGEEFNPNLLKIFTNMVGVYPIGSLVALNTGEIGIVTDTHSEVSFLLQPKVKLITDSQGNKINGKTVDLRVQQSEENGSARKIIKPLDPQEYNIRVSDYILADDLAKERFW
ncbi:MAG: HD-GYP domain-containing protein [Candidatus Aminicenantes bacterium]|nr:HD-GYP domain-containing protein [Candidatus Aminicenantes bacterium]